MHTAYALIIDNSVNNAKYIALLLRQLGYQSQIALTGSQAQIQLAFTNPDLVLLPPDLPDMSHQVILRQIKAQGRLKRTRVVLLLEKGIPEDFQADDVLALPVSKPQLQNLLQTLLYSEV